MKSIDSIAVIAACLLSRFLFFSDPTDSRKRYNLSSVQCNQNQEIVRGKRKQKNKVHDSNTTSLD